MSTCTSQRLLKPTCSELTSGTPTEASPWTASSAHGPSASSALQSTPDIPSVSTPTGCSPPPSPRVLLGPPNHSCCSCLFSGHSSLGSQRELSKMQGHSPGQSPATAFFCSPQQQNSLSQFTSPSKTWALPSPEPQSHLPPLFPVLWTAARLASCSSSALTHTALPQGLCISPPPASPVLPTCPLQIPPSWSLMAATQTRFPQGSLPSLPLPPDQVPCYT